MTKPSGWRADPKLAPKARAIGRAPKIAATVVIMIGPKRTHAGIDDRLAGRHPPLVRILAQGKIDHHNPIFS